MNKRVLGTLAFGHFINDFLNGVLSAILPLLAVHFALTYAEVGALTMVSNVASSLVQPLFGFISDKKGNPWLLSFSPLALGLGLLWIPFAPNFVWLLPAVVLSGMGSAMFHPDASRAVYFSAGARRGSAQSTFQVGGNSGMALSAVSLWFLGHFGLSASKWLMIPAVLSTIALCSIARWFISALASHHETKRKPRGSVVAGRSNGLGLSLLVSIVTVRAWIISGVSTFVPLYVVQRYHVLPQNVWVYSFVFLLFGAIGTLTGGPLADVVGQRAVVRASMIAATPFAVMLPFLPKTLLLVDLGLLGFCLLSTFAVTVVYGQEMMPQNIAMVSGLLIGFAGGVGGIGTFLMGTIADRIGLHQSLLWIVLILPIAALCTLRLPMDSSRAAQPLMSVDGTKAAEV